MPGMTCRSRADCRRRQRRPALSDAHRCQCRWLDIPDVHVRGRVSRGSAAIRAARPVSSVDECLLGTAARIGAGWVRERSCESRVFSARGETRARRHRVRFAFIGVHSCSTCSNSTGRAKPNGSETFSFKPDATDRVCRSQTRSTRATVLTRARDHAARGRPTRALRRRPERSSGTPPTPRASGSPRRRRDSP